MGKGRGRSANMVILVGMLCVALLVVFAVSDVFNLLDLKSSVHNVIVHKFDDYDIRIVEGIIETPVLVIILDESVDAFIEQALELEVDSVFLYNEDYYIFNDELSIAWRYRVDTKRRDFSLFVWEWENP